MSETENINTDNLVKAREALYRFIISQLYYDGQQSLASSMHQAIKPDPACPPSDRLFRLVLLGLQKEREAVGERTQPEDNFVSGLDLEFESDMPSAAPEPATYETCYVTSHKGACRAACFSTDGQLVATGSVDASIKIIDVDRMLAKRNELSGSIDDVATGHHPVIKTLYDHVDEVTCLEFHPKQALLASGSRDANIKIFDYAKSSTKKASTIISDAIPIRCFSFHPSGDFLAVGTDQMAVRVYDINTAQCYVNPFVQQHHTDRVSTTHWSQDARTYVTGSNDGSIKLWDGVSSRCINTFAKAHDGAGIASVMFSRNGKYVLSSGKDSMVKLWELSTSRCLIAYTGAGTLAKQQYRSRAIFNHTEDYVMLPDEATKSLCTWDARNASRKQLMSLCHNSPVRNIVHSPVTSAFLSCSDDFRCRFWVRRTATH